MATTSLERPGAAGTLAARSDLLSRFESIYREAAGDCSKVPWAHAQPCSAMTHWLDAAGPSFVRPGARVGVVGCGLGMDAAALAERGYDVIAFDACSSAIESARSLHPNIANSFIHMDLMDDPGRFRHRFDLLVEVHTLQSMPPELWGGMAQRMAELVSTRGFVLAIARGRNESVAPEAVDGPPFPLTAGELISIFRAAGLGLIGEVADFEDDNTPPVRRLRGCFGRSERDHSG